LLTKEILDHNIASVKVQLAKLLDFETKENPARLVDNASWTSEYKFLDFLRDIGKHFSVNQMVAKESVRARMEDREVGISYTEFSYMLLQAYDYLQLHRREGCTLQIGGSDQWGNITAGIELIRRVDAHEAHALTMPLVTTATGTKFGKTESGAVFLDPKQTSPYRFYQYWVNADDRDAGRFLKFFTLMPRAEIESLEHAVSTHPEKREAQQALAREVTERVHGAEAARAAVEVSALLFGKGDAASLSAAALAALAEEVPFVEIGAPADGSFETSELFVMAKLAASKGAAKRLLEQGGLSVNGKRLAAEDKAVATSAMLAGRHLLLKKGARDYALVRIQG